MKKILPIILLLFSTAAIAQYVPNGAFKNKLLEASTTNGIALDSSGDSIEVDTNGDYQISADEAEEVRELHIPASGLSNLDGIEYFTDLRVLDCSGNTIASLDLTVCEDLREIYSSGNGMDALMVAGLEDLQILDCSDNDLTSLDLTGCEYLEDLNCSENQLTTLDATDAEALANLDCSNNPDMVTLFIKNGSEEAFAPGMWATVSSLEYICADDAQVDAIVADVPATVEVNTYCFYEPGGLYNTITGVMSFDGDGDGCDGDGADVVMPSVKLVITGDAYEDSVFTDADGTYTFFVATPGEYTITPEFENAYFTAAPASVVVNFTAIDGTVATEDICVAESGTHPDIEVVIAPLTTAQPGEEAIYKMVYKNKGTEPLSGSVTCGWDSSRLSYVDTEPAFNDFGPDTYTWYFTGLQPSESREILMTLDVNSPFDLPAVNVGDVLAFTVTGESGPDDIAGDNFFVFEQEVVSAYEPYTIFSIQGDTAPVEQIGEYLHYIVNFENTGVADASFVVVKYEMNPDQFEVNTLQLIDSSHEVQTRSVENTVEFRFNTTMSAADHGNILFKVKSRTNLLEGDAVTSQANIYFEYNPPIATNVAVTEFDATAAVEGHELDNTVKIYPNPVKDNLNITAGHDLKFIELYDLQGRLLQTVLVKGTEAGIDLSGRAAGVYFVKVTTEKGVKVEKIINE